MTPSRNTRIVLRVLLYSFAIACIALIISISRSHRQFSQVAKAKLCQIEMATFKAAVKEYELMYGRLLSENNPAILRSLRGQNSNGVAFLDVGLRSVDPSGAFVDPWQTPYDIQMTSTNGFSIRSAGMNRRFGDADDVVLPP
jgi:hypothetical protein